MKEESITPFIRLFLMSFIDPSKIVKNKNDEEKPATVQSSPDKNLSLKPEQIVTESKNPKKIEENDVKVLAQNIITNDTRQEETKTIKPEQKKTVQFGVSKKNAFVFCPEDKLFNVIDINTNSQKSYTANFKVGLFFNEKFPLFSTNEGFMLYDEEGKANPCLSELTKAKKITIDPKNNERFFLLTQKNELFVVQKKGDDFEENLLKKGIDWFDVSKSLFMFVIDDMIQLWNRYDNAFKPIWSTKASKEAKFYIDDTYLYELKDRIVTVKEAQNPEQVISTTPNAKRLWKGTNVVIETESEIQIANEKIPIEGDILCADANNEHIIIVD